MSRQVEDFARGLRQLRRRAGNPSFATLAAEAGYSAQTLMDAVSGVELPPLTVTLAFVSACGGDVDAWQGRWRELAARLADADPEPEETELLSLRRRFRLALPLGRGTRAVLLLAGVLAISLTGVLLVDFTPSTPVDVATPTSWTDRAVTSSQVQQSPSGTTQSVETSRSATSVSPKPQAQSAPPLTATAPPPEYRAVAGPGCPMDFTRQVHISSAPGNDGWREVHGGSWIGDDCDNRFLYSALDVTATQSEHPENYFQWRFMFNGAAARRCLVEVYVPDSADASARVWYDVADRFENVELNIGQFMIDQYTSRGGWVSAATVSVSTATVMVQIGTNGEGLPPGRDAVAAGPLRLTCSRAG